MPRRQDWYAHGMRPRGCPLSAWSGAVLIASVLTAHPGWTLGVALGGAWRFALDPRNIGVTGGWATTAFDDSRWESIQSGTPWEQQGHPDYDGVAWYRRRVTIPAGWPAGWGWFTADSIDDTYTLFIDGIEAGHQGDDLHQRDTCWHRSTWIPVGTLIRGGGTHLIAIRVVDWKWNGGLDGVRIGIVSDPTTLGSDEAMIRALAAQTPAIWPWSAWARGERPVWTVLGLPAGEGEALTGPDGAVQPGNYRFSSRGLLFDRSRNRLLLPDPAQTDWRLVDGSLPLAQLDWRGGSIAVSQTSWVAGSTDADAVVEVNVTVRNRGTSSERLSYVRTVEPLALNGGLNQVDTVDRSSTHPGVMLVNHCAAIATDPPPDRVIGVMLDAPSASATRWMNGASLLPVHSGSGLAAAALLFDRTLAPGESAAFRFVMPFNRCATLAAESASLLATPAADRLKEARAMWTKELPVAPFVLPDPRYGECYRAQLGYMLVAMDGDQLHPGPLAYNSFWYRDGSYMVTALIDAGRTDVARRALEFFLKAQQPDGRFPPIVGSDGKPQDEMEWDSQGQAVYALMQYVRATGDTPFLESAYPAILRGVRYLAKLRATRLTSTYRTGTPDQRAVYGILPPSESAEDIGDAEWHHYWDDFWGIRGWRDAADAALRLGKKSDAAECAREGDALEASTRASITSVMRLAKIDYIPNGPEDVEESSMARGTGPAVWPCEVLDPADPLVRRSFDVYWDKWIGPQHGGFLHHDEIWGYGTELALCYVLLGERDRAVEMLDWYLGHQSAPGVYAWAESFDPVTGRFVGGDMPHAWVGADYMNLLRTCLAYERGNALVLGAGVPRAWLERGPVGVTNLPTLYGPLTYTMRLNQASGRIDLSLAAGAHPPGGFLWSPPAGNGPPRPVQPGEHADSVVLP